MFQHLLFKQLANTMFTFISDLIYIILLGFFQMEKNIFFTINLLRQIVPPTNVESVSIHETKNCLPVTSRQSITPRKLSNQPIFSLSLKDSHFKVFFLSQNEGKLFQQIKSIDGCLDLFTVFCTIIAKRWKDETEL